MARDARLISQEFLKDDIVGHLALSTLGDSGLCAWERDMVLFALFSDEYGNPSEDTVFISWCAGNLKMIADVVQRTGKKYVIFQRMFKDTPSARWRKMPIEKMYKLIYSHE